MAVTYRQNPVWLAPFLASSVIPVGEDDRRRAWYEALGATILALRVERGPALDIYTQGDLGKAVGVSGATVLRWEGAREAPPDAWEIYRLCEIFAVTPEELIHPEPMSVRERELLRRAGKQLRRTLDREREDDAPPS